MSDDKLHVIWCVTIIGLASMYFLPEPAMVINSIISGLFGVAVGRASA